MKMEMKEDSEEKEGLSGRSHGRMYLHSTGFMYAWHCIVFTIMKMTERIALKAWTIVEYLRLTWNSVQQTHL